VESEIGDEAGSEDAARHCPAVRPVRKLNSYSARNSHVACGKMMRAALPIPLPRISAEARPEQVILEIFNAAEALRTPPLAAFEGELIFSR